MNSQSALAPEPEARLASPSLEEQWANALDCGALGPSQDEPQLFYQAK